MIILFLGILIIGNIGLIYAQENNRDGLAVTIAVDKHHYNYCEQVEIQGMVYNGSTGDPIKTKVLIQIFNEENLIYSISTVSSENGSYLDTGYHASESGFLKVTATVNLGKYYETASITIFSYSLETLPDLFLYYPLQLFMIFIAISLYIIIIVFYVTQDLEGSSKTDDKLTKWNKLTKWLSNPRRIVATQFIFLSIFTISILCILVFTPAQIGTTSPIGLVQNTYENSTNWVINVGGMRIDNSTQYFGGVQIPVYVIAFSFVGAYVFFLDKVPDLVKEKNIKQLYDDSLKYLARFFIAPFLAIALYLVLWQLEVRGTFILAAVSFATGLIIEEVTTRILEFAKDVLGKKANTKNGDQTKPEKN